MNESEAICPYCGRKFKKNFFHTISHEETMSRDYNMRSTWIGKSYIEETKRIRNFSVYCCEKCYKENEENQKEWDSYIKYVGSICALVGIVIRIVIARDWNILAYLLVGVLGLFIAAIFGLLIFPREKKTSYNHAKECGALVDYSQLYRQHYNSR